MEDYLLLFYQGKDNMDQLYYASFDGSTWGGNTSGPLKSKGNPGAAFFENSIHLCYIGDKYNLYQTTYQGGDSWPDGHHILTARSNPDNGDCGPNIIKLGDGLFTAFKGYNQTDLRTACSQNGVWFGGNKLDSISPKSNMNPAITIFQKKLYLFYKGDSSNQLYWAWCEASLDEATKGTWYGNIEISVDEDGQEIALKSDRSPAAVVYDDKLYLFYKNPDKNQIYYSFYDGNKWSGNLAVGHDQKDFNPKSNDGPSAIVFRDKMYLIYCGESDAHIYFSVFDKQSWSGNNEIKVNNQKIQSSHVPGVTLGITHPTDHASWMLNVPDDTLISNLNLPGTHDSAAINSSIHTPYACQNYSITDQLKYGIRVLDVRLKETTVGDTIVFDTCHGDKLSKLGTNVYQSFDSLLNECQKFLNDNPSECIVMTLKFDDPNNLKGRTAEERYQIELALTQVLTQSASPDRRNLFAMQSDIPKLKDVRGKIYLYNRIVKSPAAGINLGTYVSWTDNTDGEKADSVQDIYVQDRWDLTGMPSNVSSLKPQLIENAFQQKTDVNIVLNFASGVYVVSKVPYVVIAKLLNFFGKDPAAKRPVHFGWTMFDFPFSVYYTDVYSYLTIVDIIVQSNFGYAGYEKAFKLTNNRG